MANTAGSQKDTANVDSTRRTYNITSLGEDIVELWDPSATPFLVLSSQLRKENTSDPKPTKLVHTSNYPDRKFFAAGAGTWSAGGIDDLAVELTVAGSDNVGFLITGLILRIKASAGDDVAIIDTVDSQQQIHITSISGTNNIADGDEIQVVGTAFARGADKATAVYDTTTSEYSYTQIFKTVVNVTGTLAATATFGGNEYQRLLKDKRGEHLTDIERMLVLGTRGATTVGSDTIYTSYGMVSYVEDNSSTSTSLSRVYNNYPFDTFIDDMQGYYIKGGNQATDEKLCLCGASVMSLFSKIQNGKLWGNAELTFTEGIDELGVKITAVKHPWGILHLTHEPVFRGNSTNSFYQDYMCMVELKNTFLMPLVAHGENRDTQLQEGLPTTKDEYIDQYLTEVALLPVHAPSHGLIKFS